MFSKISLSSDVESPLNSLKWQKLKLPYEEKRKILSAYIFNLKSFISINGFCLVSFALVFPHRVCLCVGLAVFYGTHSTNQVGLELRYSTASCLLNSGVEGVHHHCLTVWVFYLHVSAPWACSAHRGQKRVSVPLKLESHRCFKPPCGCWKANTSPLNHWNNSPTPSTMFLKLPHLGWASDFLQWIWQQDHRLQKKQEKQATR